MTHEIGGTTCYRHWILRLVISHTKQEIRFVTGIRFCVLSYHTRDRGTICHGHWVQRPAMSHTRQGVRFVTDIGFCIL